MDSKNFQIIQYVAKKILKRITLFATELDSSLKKEKNFNMEKNKFLVLLLECIAYWSENFSNDNSKYIILHLSMRKITFPSKPYAFFKNDIKKENKIPFEENQIIFSIFTLKIKF